MEQNKEIKCEICGAPFEEHKYLHGHSEEMRWDGHTYHATCKHFPETALLSVG